MSNGAAAAEASDIEPPIRTVLLPRKLLVELPAPLAAGDEDADDGRALLEA
jgi:hypothetical protein